MSTDWVSMKSDQEQPPSYSSATSGPASTPGRAARFLGKAGLDPPPPVPVLVKLPVTDFESSLSDHVDAARALLVQHRVSRPDYRMPGTQKRDFFRRAEKKRAVRDEAQWTFTKHEVAQTLGGLLSQQPLPAPGVAHALLSHASVSCLDELWAHWHDSKLEKRLKSRIRRSRTSVVPDVPWLDGVTGQDNADYVRLLCQAGLGQEALDRAFAMALARRSMEVMELLLGFGGSASACQDDVRERVQGEDVALATLLLSAPVPAMSVEAWRHCLAAGAPSSILLLCLANRPRIVCGPLLLQAVKSRSFEATAALLAYASKESRLDDVGQLACGLASRVDDASRRHDFFTLLGDAGLVVDGLAVRNELMTDAKARHFPILKLLVGAGVALDVKPHNAVEYAVSKMDLEMLDLFQGGTYLTPAALALNAAPESTTEPQLLRLIDILEPRGLQGEPLDVLLVRAGHKQYIELAERLVRLGASVEYKAASAIQAAVANEHFDMLAILLRGSCSAPVLSVALPIAMALQSRSNRRRAIEVLVEKGVLKRQLGVSLQFVMAEADDVDSGLVAALLQYGAPVEGVGNDATNPVLQAVRRCNLTVLLMLCDAGAKLNTISKAVPIAFEAIQTCEYDVALETMKVLLERGAMGPPVHETLLVAVREDHRLDMVRILIEHGGEANFANGAAFDVALKTANLELLEILCLGCPPSRASTECLLYTAIDPEVYSLEALDLLLGSTQSAGAALGAAWDSEKLRGNPNLNSVVPCFLQHGLDVDLGDGALLCFAVREIDINLLKCMLSSGPSVNSLTTAFDVTNSVKEREVSLEVMGLLLDEAQSAEIGQSRGLVKQTVVAMSGDFAGLDLFLHHMAAIDFEDGAAVQVAATSGIVELLDYLLVHQPAVATLQKACLAVAASPGLSFDEKHPIFDSLFNARDRELTDAENMLQLLADSVTDLPDHTQLPMLLITRGAKIHWHTLKVAVQTSSRELFEILVNVQNATTIAKIFKEARTTSMPADRKYWMYEILLGRGVPGDETSIALIDSLQGRTLGDLSVPKLLLEHGADVSYRECTAFYHALRMNSVLAMQLLSQYLLDDDAACVAFDLARDAPALSPDVRVEVYSCLLQWNISAISLYGALVKHLESGHADILVVQMLLAKGADPNEEAARCFVLAAAAGKESIFRALSRQASLSPVLRALMHHFRAEWEVLLWFSTCLEEQQHLATIDEHDLLYQCMRKFSAGSGLLRVLLDRGVSPAAPMEMSIAGLPPEACSPLIWALVAEPKIHNDTILTLLDCAGHEALPMYSMPSTGVTAAFACLFDKGRTPILEILLHLDRERTLESSTPASTFRRFCGGGDGEDNWDSLPSEFSLQTASLMLGNFDAYRAMDCGETADDGTLHTAAFSALPKFVEWLLDYHEPNAKSQDFDQMIPLAVACTSNIQPWTKIADQEADFATRRQECIKLLVPETNLNWRYRNKTVLHVALDQGLEVTRIMIEALGVSQDPERNEKYLYQDKDGIFYSLDQYVRRRMQALNSVEQDLLVRLISSNNIQSRYYRSVMPGDGKQPLGYHGLPPGYASAWENDGQDLAQ